MAITEKLKFKIGLSGVYWEKHPQYSIFLDDNFICTGTIQVPTAVKTESGLYVYPEEQYEEFECEVIEGPRQLKIRLENKTDLDVVKDNYNTDSYTIINDMLLCIRSVEIDDVNLGNLIWSKCVFRGDDSARPVLDNCVDLGWNGTWALDFESPFYIWLLENI